MTPRSIDPLRTPAEVATELTNRIRTLRLLRNWKRETLATRSGVNVHTLKRFERTGQISLEAFLKLCDALERLDDLEHILEPPPARSMKELERLAERRPPRRGRL